MTKLDSICEIAAGNYGLVTSAEAAGAGGTRAELSRYAGDGRLERRGRGACRLARWVPTPYGRFAPRLAPGAPRSARRAAHEPPLREKILSGLRKNPWIDGTASGRRLSTFSDLCISSTSITELPV